MSAIGRLPSVARRVPSASWLCGTIAFLNVVVWGLVAPPFQVPDENAHVAYVQQLAENGEPPNQPGGPVYAREETEVLLALHFNPTVGRRENHSIWYALQDQGLDAVESADFSRTDGGGTTSASNQPPLFYGLEAGVYLISPWDTLLQRVALMRLVSAFLAAMTAVFVFLFLRETFAEQWIWTVGSLAVAFQPQFGFISSGVTPDSLLFAASAALFYTFARVFRHGLTAGRALAIGAALAVGVLAKLTFVALLPGALFGLALLVWRSCSRVAVLRFAGAAVAITAAVSLAYLALNLFVWDRSALGGGIEGSAVGATSNQAGVAQVVMGERLSYTWQLYLPRLPFMSEQFEYFPLRETWFDGTVGRFGWLDTPFPGWVYTLALWVAIPLILLAIVALVQRRATLLARWPELAVYGTMVAGLLVSIGFSGVRYRKDTGMGFEQARYLFPLLPLYAAAVALAALGAGRRLARPVGAGVVVLAMGHSVFAQLLVIGRFYA